MQLEIVSPEAQLFSGEVVSLTVPGASGSFQILNNHAPIVSTLVEGRVKIQGKVIINENNRSKFIQEGEFTFLDIQSGAIELSDNKVILLTD
ncbi:F0F1 ATP synthase subunit epsilon [Flavobacteriaceae bacterium]|jgi:F-type H+-transporting ATPase subunit epsilon|nr:F0F1 ATP synthase subunit epsilon [Flavobacteriaceae bacterium]MDA9879702.1 F0F1 ATP synthase subunit epsilon [Flavobacteriaceae bacterium]MDB2328035.1 F0F1 ATP synthase subunit epsilon [Flavobacteriaceae bacterium]